MPARRARERPHDSRRVSTRVSNSRKKSISYANIAARIDFDQDRFYQPPHSVNQVAVKIISCANSLRDWFASD
jgi:hypothetical protein